MASLHQKTEAWGVEKSNTVRPLLDLQKGQRGQVRSVHASGALGHRLRDMGLLPGVEVLVTGRAPLGCPLSVALDGYELSLRCEEAEQILVQCQQTQA